MRHIRSISLLVFRAKQGGTSPDTNAQLQTVMDAAKKANVPNDVIARNLKRAEDKDVALLSDIIIEAYGPGGTGFIFECLTDNKTRASTEIWTVVKKLDGKVCIILPPHTLIVASEAGDHVRHAPITVGIRRAHDQCRRFVSARHVDHTATGRGGTPTVVVQLMHGWLFRWLRLTVLPSISTG